MTTNDEMLRAIVLAEKFLVRIADGTEKKIPSKTRDMARMILRHYPLRSNDVVIKK